MLIQQKQIENDNIDFSDFEEELKELAEQEKQYKKPVGIKKIAPKRNNNMINELLAKKLK
jgi:mRNA-degrading endonuclease HigB of HigAB toxin-antitoxin module